MPHQGVDGSGIQLYSMGHSQKSELKKDGSFLETWHQLSAMIQMLKDYEILKRHEGTTSTATICRSPKIHAESTHLLNVIFLATEDLEQIPLQSTKILTIIRSPLGLGVGSSWFCEF